MAKRLLDCFTSDFEKFTKKELLESIMKSEGRVMACETIGVLQPMLGNVTNAEFAASMGADLLLLNMLDVEHPVVLGLPDTEPQEVVRVIKKLTGRPVGINLEPVAEGWVEEPDAMFGMTKGRRATAENAKKARDMGVDMIVLTGNPGTGVGNEEIVRSLQELRRVVGEQVILTAGKMHASGIMTEAAEHIITKEDIKRFAEAGADMILMPAPGTVPGITMEYIRGLVSYAHGLKLLTMTAIGTSQEGANQDTIRQIALMCKMTGTDVHHIGDTGYGGIALPENIFAYSVAIRGIRHTYHRMASSVRR